MRRRCTKFFIKFSPVIVRKVFIFHIFTVSAHFYLSDQNSRNLIPFFQCAAVLSIPNIVLQPALDEVQGAVTKAAHTIVQVASGVSQWNKDRVKSKPTNKKDEKASNGEHCPGHCQTDDLASGLRLWHCAVLSAMESMESIYRDH